MEVTHAEPTPEAVPLREQQLQEKMQKDIRGIKTKLEITLSIRETNYETNKKRIAMQRSPKYIIN